MGKGRSQFFVRRPHGCTRYAEQRFLKDFSARRYVSGV